MLHRGWWPREEYHVSSHPAKPERLTDYTRIPNASSRSHQHLEAQDHQRAVPATPLQQTERTAGVPATVNEQTGQDANDTLDWQSKLLSQVLPGFKAAQPSQAFSVAPVAQKSTNSSQTKSSVLLYAGIFLDSLSIAKLLYWAPPVFSCLSADHLTLLYRPSAEEVEMLPLGDPVELAVASKMHDAAVQAISVQAPAWVVKHLRCPAHVTISAARGIKAKQAGDLVRKVQQGHIYGIEQSACFEDVRLTGRVGVKLENSSIAYSATEVQAALHACPNGLTSGLAPVRPWHQTQNMSLDDAPASAAASVTTASAAAPPLSRPAFKDVQIASAQNTSGAQMDLSNSVGLLRPLPQKTVEDSCRAATVFRAGPSITHRQTPVSAALQSAPAPVRVHSPPGHAFIEVDDDDAFAAMEELDAICAPSNVRRPQLHHHRQLLQQPRYINRSSSHPAAHAHTSISADHVSAYQSSSPDTSPSKHYRPFRIQSDESSPQSGSPRSPRYSSSSRGHVSSRGSHGVGRLWVPPPDDAPMKIHPPPTAAAAAPVRILRRSGTMPASAAAVSDIAPGLTSGPGLSGSTLAGPTQPSQARTVHADPPAAAAAAAEPKLASPAGPVLSASRGLVAPQKGFAPPGLTPKAKQPGSASAAAAAAMSQRIPPPPGLVRKGLQEPTATLPAQTALLPTTPLPGPSLPNDAHTPVSTASASIPAASALGVALKPKSTAPTIEAESNAASESSWGVRPLVGSPEICPTEPMTTPQGMAVAYGATASTGAQAGGGDGVTALSSDQKAGDGMPLRSRSPELDDLVWELQLRHLRDKIPGLAPAMAQFALKAARGNVENALSLLQEHASLLSQLTPTSPAHTTASGCPDKQQLPMQAGQHSLPSSGSTGPTQSSAQTSLTPAQSSTQSTLSKSSARSGSAHEASTSNDESLCQAHDRDDAMHGSAPARRAPQLLPAGAIPAGLASASAFPAGAVPAGAVPAGAIPAGAGLAVRAENSTPKDGLAASHRSLSCEDTPKAAPHGAMYSSTDSADSVQEVLPETADAAMEAASKVLQERNKIKGMADSERQALNMHQRACDVYYEAAKTAYDRGDKEAAQELAGRGKEQAQLAKEARSRANQAAYDSSNLSVVNRFKVDLHGMHVDEALQVLENHLLNLGGLGCPGGVLLQVITGVGKHSINGQPKILPAVVRYLSDAGYRFLAARGNPGVLDVSIGGRRSAAV